MKGKAVLLSALSAGCMATSPAIHESKLEFRNGVDECMTFEIDELRRSGNVGLASVNVVHVQDLSACGCRSRVLSYSVTEIVGAVVNGAVVQRGFGRVVPDASVTMVVASDVRLVGPATRTIEVSCAPED